MTVPTLPLPPPLHMPPPSGEVLPPSLTSLAPHSPLLAATAANLIRRKTFTAKDLPALRTYRDEAFRLLIPAGDHAVISAVGRLSLHYPQPSMDAEANASRWDDWCDNFADVPADLLAAGCAAWRRSPARFAPSPGQLLALCQGARFRRRLAEDAAAVIAHLETTA